MKSKKVLNSVNEFLIKSYNHFPVKKLSKKEKIDQSREAYLKLNNKNSAYSIITRRLNNL